MTYLSIFSLVAFACSLLKNEKTDNIHSRRKDVSIQHPPSSLLLISNTHSRYECTPNITEAQLQLIT